MEMGRRKKNNLPITEDLDFHYLLTLMPALSNKKEFAWLPELFSIIGYESLINLCKYAGGETITIPTLDELSDSLCALQYFYEINIKKNNIEYYLPEYIKPLYNKIKDEYNAQNS